MNTKPTVITERVDDMPLLLAQMERMGLAAVLDAHVPTHGNWQGLSFGRVTTIWLSSILSRGDHRLVHVEPWVAQRQMMLSQATGGVVRAHECSDDRLEIVLRLLSDDEAWVAFESSPINIWCGSMTSRLHVSMSIAPAPVRRRALATTGCFSLLTAKITARTCLKSRSCRRCWTRWGCRSSPRWCRESGPMTRSLCRVSSEYRPVEAVAAYYM